MTRRFFKVLFETWAIDRETITPITPTNNGSYIRQMCNNLAIKRCVCIGAGNIFGVSKFFNCLFTLWLKGITSSSVQFRNFK